MAKSKTQAKETETVKAGKKQEKKTVDSKKESKVETPVQTVQTKAPKKTQKGGEKEKKPKRSFKALYVNPDGEVVIEGRYCGAKPKQAGCKALTGIYKLFAKAKKQLKGEIYFGVRETTRGSRNKTYYYCGERVVLDKPIKLQIGGGDKESESKTITYKYNSNVKKAQESDCEHLANPKEIEADEVVEEPKKASKKAEAKAEVKAEVKVEAKVEAKKEPKKTKQAKK